MKALIPMLLGLSMLACTAPVAANLHNFPDGKVLEVYTNESTVPFKLWNRVGVDSSFTLTLETMKTKKSYTVPLIANGEKRMLVLPIRGERGKGKEYRVCTTANNITQLNVTTCSTFLIKRY